MPHCFESDAIDAVLESLTSSGRPSEAGKFWMQCASVSPFIIQDMPPLYLLTTSFGSGRGA